MFEMMKHIYPRQREPWQFVCNSMVLVKSYKEKGNLAATFDSFCVYKYSEFS